MNVVATPRSIHASQARMQVQERAWLTRLYWTSFAFRVGIAVIGINGTVFLRIPLLEDANYYDSVARDIANDWMSGVASSWLDAHGSETGRPILMLMILALFYFLTAGLGSITLIAILYGAVCSFMPGVVYRVMIELKLTTRAARLSAWIVAFTPAFAFYSGALHKEGLVLLLYAAIFLHSVRLLKRWDGKRALFVYTCLAALFLVRFYLAIIVTPIITASLLLNTRGSSHPGNLLAKWLFGTAVASFCFAILMTQIEPMLPMTVAESFEYLADRRRGSAVEAESGYLPDADTSTPQKALAYLPEGVFYFLTVPWPWQTEKLRQILAIPDTLMWVAAYPLVFLGARKLLRHNPAATIMLLTCAFGMTMFYPLFVSNVGTAYRMRIQVWFCLLPFAAVGWYMVLGNPGVTPVANRSMPGVPRTVNSVNF